MNIEKKLPLYRERMQEIVYRLGGSGGFHPG